MIKTDFSTVKDLFLVYPYGFDEENASLTDFFEELIGLIPEELHQYIIVNNKEASEKIKNIYPNKNIDTIIIKDFSEIWLRDILGFNTEGNKIIKPKYKPDYYSNVYDKKYLNLLEEQTREIINTTIKKEIIDIPLIMDGGNLVTNGEIGFITDKIFQDNKDKSKEEIKEILNEYLGIRPIIIETSKYDKLGHSDGYLAFLNEKEICLAEYPEMKFLKEDIAFLKRLEGVLLENGLDIIKIYDRPVDEKTKSKHNDSNNFLCSAKGNYVNLLRINKTIIVPQFTLSTSKESNIYNQINKDSLSKKIACVKSINLDELAHLGGGLHCISITN